MKPTRILVIEDEAALARALGTVCERLGCLPEICASGRRGLEHISTTSWALVILDIGLPDMSGLRVLESVNRANPRPPVLIITAHGTLDNAVAARQLGAAGYLVKPLDLPVLEGQIRQILEVQARSTTSDGASPTASDSASGDELGALLGGAAPAMQRAFLAIAHATTSDAPALLTGPTGTGKTLVARVVHANSRRRHSPFVTLQCGALPEPLLESELFGHEKQAFTGAHSMRTGHLERAAGGTLFLDEIGDIPSSVQAKLLRFVEEKTFSRLGGREDLRVDLRLLTATHRNLRDEVRKGRFREDLFYRLNVLEIEMPPLVERAEDIPALSAYFLGRLGSGRDLALSAESLRCVSAYRWPGNVRELRNALEYAVTVCPGRLIQPEHLPRQIRQGGDTQSETIAELDRVLQSWVGARVAAGATYKQIYAEIESTVLRHLLRYFEQKPSVLARVLKMNRATLLKKRRDLGLDSPP